MSWINDRFPLAEVFGHLRVSRRDFGALGLVALLHAAIVLLVISSSKVDVARIDASEIHVSLARSGGTVPLPRMAIEDPLLLIVQPPDFVIDDKGFDAPAALPVSMVLAPRPDPAHPNPSPIVAGSSVPRGGSLVVKLQILADGTVGDAAIVESTGTDNLDREAMAYVKDNWHFLPALLSGKAVTYWITTVVVIG